MKEFRREIDFDTKNCSPPCLRSSSAGFQLARQYKIRSGVKFDIHHLLQNFQGFRLRLDLRSYFHAFSDFGKKIEEFCGRLRFVRYLVKARLHWTTFVIQQSATFVGKSWRSKSSSVDEVKTSANNVGDCWSV